MRKIDFHTHILPRVDDGAVDLNMSLNMLSLLSEQQVDTVVLTPHYYSHRESIEQFVERRDKAYEELELKRSSLSLPVTLRLGAEVYFSEYLFNNENLSRLCIDRTKTMLLELPFGKPVDGRMVDQVERLINEYAVDIVLAHVERYPSVLKSPAVLEALLDIGCVCQINLSSFCAFGKRRLLSLVKKGYVGALGTDSHNLSTRKPIYNDGVSIIRKKLDDEAYSDIAETMASLLKP